MGSFSWLKFNDVTYNKLLALSSALYGFLFITIININYSIEDFNSFVYTKQFLIFIVTFSDWISIPLLNKLNNKLSLIQIVVSKLLFSSIVLFFITENNSTLFFSLILINVIYNSIHIYFFQNNQYKTNFIIHAVCFILSFTFLWFFIDNSIEPIIYFFLSNTLIIFISLFFILRFEKFNSFSLLELCQEIKKDIRGFTILSFSIILQPITYNYFLLKFKEINVNELFYLEYFFMLSSMFSSIILVSYANNIFTKNEKPNVLYILFYFIVYVFFTIIFIYFLDEINNNNINYFSWDIVYFFCVDIIKTIALFFSYHYIIKKEFYIPVLTEIAGTLFSLLIINFYDEISVIVFPALISLFLLIIHFNIYFEKDSNYMARDN